MLTVPQAVILALLQDFKYLRYSHIQKYMAAKHNTRNEHLSLMLKQLKFLGKVTFTGDYVMLPGRKPNNGILKAMDVVLDLTNGNVDLLCLGTAPFTLMFSVKASDTGSSYHTFGVVIAERFFENSIISHLQTIDRELTVIFILTDMEQQKLLQVENKHYFALQEASGKYRFFKSAQLKHK